MARSGFLAGLLAAAVVLVPAAASAQIWSLASPPLTEGTTTPNAGAALSEWTIWYVYPAQQVCEEHRALWRMVIKAEDDESVRAAGRRAVFVKGIPAPSANMDVLEENARRWVRETGAKLRSDKGVTNQVMTAQCVSAADPRLQPAK